MARFSLTFLTLLPPAFLFLLFANKQIGDKDGSLVDVDRQVNITTNSPILVYNKVNTALPFLPIMNQTR